MQIKNRIKKILIDYNPLVILRRKHMRSAIKNKTATFLCPNCIGGILFHDLDLQFRSPTVNTMMIQSDFVKFVLNLEDYLNQELVFFRHPELNCPCAKLGDITIHFTHYQTQQEAEQKWRERSARIDRNTLFIFLSERDGLTREDFLRLGSVSARGLVIFTANEYADIPYTVQIKKYSRDGFVGNILAMSYLTGQREYEKYFDFVEWFNRAIGGNFDITPFVKRQ